MLQLLRDEAARLREERELWIEAGARGQLRPAEAYVAEEVIDGLEAQLAALEEEIEASEPLAAERAAVESRAREEGVWGEQLERERVVRAKKKRWVW